MGTYLVLTWRTKGPKPFKRVLTWRTALSRCDSSIGKRPLCRYARRTNGGRGARKRECRAVHATAQSIDASGIFHATLSHCGQHTLPSSLAPPGHQERVLTSRGCLLSAQMARERSEPIRAPISTASCSQCEYTATCTGLASASAAATPTVAATQRNAAPAEAYDSVACVPYSAVVQPISTRCATTRSFDRT